VLAAPGLAQLDDDLASAPGRNEPAEARPAAVLRPDLEGLRAAVAVLDPPERARKRGGEGRREPQSARVTGPGQSGPPSARRALKAGLA